MTTRPPWRSEGNWRREQYMLSQRFTTEIAAARRADSRVEAQELAAWLIEVAEQAVDQALHENAQHLKPDVLLSIGIRPEAYTKQCDDCEAFTLDRFTKRRTA